MTSSRIAAHSSAPGVLDELWAALNELPILEQSWPISARQTYFGALDPAEAQRLRAQIDFVRKFAIEPIVAVAGLINSGKSSLIGSFLTPAGRARVLRGIDSAHGTQRFTLWLPASWKANAALFAQLEEALARVFGHAPEPLAAHIQDAHAQQRAHNLIRTPLLAFDEALDAQGLGLLDCPDIQRRESADDAAENLRLAALTAAGEICAGVILVAGRKELEVSTLQAIAAALPSATRVYAINLLRNEPPHEVLRETREALGRDDALCFVAYDHDVERNRAFAPRLDPNFAEDAMTAPDERVPFFFEAAPDPERNAPDAVTAERAIIHLGQRLGPEALRQKRQTEQICELRDRLIVGLRQLEESVATRGKEIDRAAGDLFESLRQLMHDGENQRIKMDPEIALSMAESVRRTAPVDIRAMLVLNSGLFAAFRKLGAWGRAGVSWMLEPLDAAFPSTLLGRVREFFRSERAAAGVVAAEDLQVRLALWSGGLGIARAKAFWAEDARAIMDRLRQEERTNMQPAQWDELTREAWKTAPKVRARLLAIIPFLLTLLAAAAYPFDPTGTTSHAIFGITIKEMVGVAVVGGSVGGLFGLTGGGVLQRGIEQYIGHQQLSNFFAIACDRVGLLRDQMPEQWAKQYPKPNISEQRKRDAFGIKELRWMRARLLRENVERLRTMVRAL